MNVELKAAVQEILDAVDAIVRNKRWKTSDVISAMEEITDHIEPTVDGMKEDLAAGRG